MTEQEAAKEIVDLIASESDGSWIIPPAGVKAIERIIRDALNGIDAAGLAEAIMASDWVKNGHLTIACDPAYMPEGFTEGEELANTLGILTAAIQSYRPDSRVQRLVEAAEVMLEAEKIGADMAIAVATDALRAAGK
jgi:hypothetical protein